MSDRKLIMAMVVCFLTGAAVVLLACMVVV